MRHYGGHLSSHQRICDRKRHPKRLLQHPCGLLTSGLRLQPRGEGLLLTQSIILATRGSSSMKHHFGSEDQFVLSDIY